MNRRMWVGCAAAALLFIGIVIGGVVAGALLIWRMEGTTTNATPVPGDPSAAQPPATATARPTDIAAAPPASATPSGTATVLSTPTNGATASPTAAPSATPPGRPTVPSGKPDTTLPAPEEVLSATLEQVEAAILPQRDLFEAAIRFGQIPPDALRVVSESDPGYQPGDRLSFTVSDLAESSHSQVEAELRAQTPHASWWVATNVEIDQADLESSARVFEEQSYPTNRALFGSEWSPGVDGDPRVHIFLGEVPGVGGYFSSADEFPRSVNPFSNEKEIFYINSDNARPGDSYFDGILAHEFQHMIHWNMDRNEELWINEGLSELAAKINGFDVGTAASAFARDPDLPLTRWYDQELPFYGSSFLFLNYFHQRFGDDAVSELVQSQADGPEAFDALLAEDGTSFDELFANWVVANLVDTPELEDGRFDYEDDSARRPNITRTVRAYPSIELDTVHQYGTDYIVFEPGGGSGTLTVEFSGESTVVLVPTEAHSGEWMAWSHRGDDSNTRLTRAFDLTNLESATLNFWTWYDLEPDYDYAYLSVSTDGGTRWQILPSASTTDSNPNGNSFGHAFTGRSGRGKDEGADAAWVEESVDLSPFAGQPVLVRFEVITDDALNNNGFVVDDISLPELGYEEGFEAGLGDWEDEGFVRADNLLPQSWIVQALVEGRGIREVVPISVDGAGRGTLTVEGFGSTSRRVTLMVSGATHFTSEKAPYEFSARHRRQEPAP